ncbi:hypothetical protein Bhyg_05048 [Pseudolycoriella hygida]|uniref:Uncharacterized protein n=1 Tax=Pseudolycoriella hygida TaxID=35572 RepID=A0A9Q0SA12_9DIPT|nr:hypothetical protein Bhyg_05048 [Pseudolycoriella hygida]
MKKYICVFALFIVAASAFPFDTTVPPDSCYSCRDAIIHITDTWAGQCFPMEDDVSCNCVCADVFCHINEFIDRTTCRPDGRIQDCRCIPIATTVQTNLID